MPHEEVDNTNQIEEKTAALLELGSVPMSIFKELVKLMDKLKAPNPVNKKKLITAFLSLSLLFLSACSTVERAWDNLIPEPYGPPSHIQEGLISQAADAARQEAEGTSNFPILRSAESVETNNYQPSQFSESWQQFARVQEKEGIMAALRRASGGANPGEHTNVPDGVQQYVEILHVEDPNNPDDDWLEVYSWSQLLSLNPAVRPGDIIVDSFRAVLRLAHPLLPENDHTQN